MPRPGSAELVEAAASTTRIADRRNNVFTDFVTALPFFSIRTRSRDVLDKLLPSAPPKSPETPGCPLRLAWPDLLRTVAVQRRRRCHQTDRPITFSPKRPDTSLTARAIRQLQAHGGRPYAQLTTRLDELVEKLEPCRHHRIGVQAFTFLSACLVSTAEVAQEFSS